MPENVITAEKVMKEKTIVHYCHYRDTYVQAAFLSLCTD